jgi:hypothetical protein
VHIREKKGTGWWNMGIWRLKGMRVNIDKGICMPCTQEGVSHILQCEGTRNWRLGKKSLHKYIWRSE